MASTSEHDDIPELVEHPTVPALEAIELMSLLKQVAQAIGERRGSTLESDPVLVVDEMVALVRGETSMKELVKAREPCEPGSPDWKRVRNSIDQRHARTRKRLLDEIDRRVEAGSLESPTAAALRKIVEETRLIRRKRLGDGDL